MQTLAVFQLYHGCGIRNEQENKDAKIKIDLSIYTEILATRLCES
jgi:hypothetical protein